MAPPAKLSPGRPTVGVRVPVRLPGDLLDEIDRRARVLGRSRAAVIRSLLRSALVDVEPPDDGVDRAQIRRMLAMSPPDRVRHMADVAAEQERVRSHGRKPR